MKREDVVRRLSKLVKFELYSNSMMESFLLLAQENFGSSITREDLHLRFLYFKHGWSRAQRRLE